MLSEAAANSTVLVVDDMASMRAITKKVLKTYGVKNIVEAENGKQGLGRLKVSKIDLVICDWDMPEMNGYELLQVVKGNARLSKIPFIMLTANTSKDFVIKSLQARVDDYIVKPYQPQALIDKVKQHLN